LVFGALYLHMLDDIGHGRKSREQRDKACRHIELHVDQQRSAEAQSKHADQREQLLAAAGDGIGGELPDESSPHSRFSVMTLRQRTTGGFTGTVRGQIGTGRPDRNPRKRLWREALWRPCSWPFCGARMRRICGSSPDEVMVSPCRTTSAICW
jgi:hypothetical protein